MNGTNKNDKIRYPQEEKIRYPNDEKIRYQDEKNTTDSAELTEENLHRHNSIIERKTKLELTETYVTTVRLHQLKQQVDETGENEKVQYHQSQDEENTSDSEKTLVWVTKIPRRTAELTEENLHRHNAMMKHKSKLKTTETYLRLHHLNQQMTETNQNQYYEDENPTNDVVWVTKTPRKSNELTKANLEQHNPKKKQKKCELTEINLTLNHLKQKVEILESQQSHKPVENSLNAKENKQKHPVVKCKYGILCTNILTPNGCKYYHTTCKKGKNCEFHTSGNCVFYHPK